MKKNKCHRHNQILAPMGMAWLIEKGREDEQADRANVRRLFEFEKKNMRGGIMATRHFIHNGWCEERFISYR